ncbi:radical SAM protein [Marinospirillum sp. MEB164]|uniref:Radical SAM protein n=1 Tax=Marinospirillum alkalitolerans TaxID=3123374 RepID=A0ABW8Q1B1_9GAMM
MPKTRWTSAAPADQTAPAMQQVFEAGERHHHIANTAYPLAHQQTWKPYRVRQNEQAERLVKAFDGLDQLTLYSHLPFCETRCYFCEYTVVGRAELAHTSLYMQYLGQELAAYRALLGPRELLGWDIGGGTPSFVDAALIDQHIEQVTRHFHLVDGAKVSIETTPKIAAAEPEKIAAYFAAGIRRISMGIQVTQPDLLKVLGREENGIAQIDQAVAHIRRAGFTEFNIDLMYGFAGQSLASWEATLRYALAMQPEFITLYRMRYKLTRISSQADQVTPEQVRLQSQLAKTLLKEAGYWANPGKNTFSRLPAQTGTSSYLTQRVIHGRSYLGLGLGAQSMTDTSISYNAGAVGKNLAPYFKRLDQQQLPLQDFYDLPAIQMMAKMVAVSFYFGEVNLAAFERKFGLPLEAAYPEAVDYALQQGLMHYTDSRNGQEWPDQPRRSLSLTDKGAAHFNGSIALFYAPSVQNYLLEKNVAEDLARQERAAQQVFERNQRIASVPLSATD